MQLKDSLYSRDKISALEELNVKYETREIERRTDALKKEADLQRVKLQRKDLLLYGGGSLALLLLASSLLLLRNSRLRANQKLMQLEQKQLLSQMNPHFIFNCLNSVQQFVIQNDIANANKYLADFSMLMRQTLDNSREGMIPLYRELEYLENYLSLEAMRFEDLFRYSVACTADIDANNTEIPSMIIQPFVENAINHGLVNLEGRAGWLSVDFYKQEAHLCCKVEDNGIGMEQAAIIKERAYIRHESKGIEMTRQRLALVSRLNGTDYQLEIKDRKGADGNSEGTIVIIKFPLNA